jgi:imidazolonepropionase-like amidohydrolase
VGEFTPDVEAWVSVNPDSELIPVARANGFTHALVAPMGGSITGASGLIKLAGWGVEDMTVKTHAALHLWWPVMSLNTRPKQTLRDPDKYKSPKEQTRTRDKNIKAIDEFFNEAEAYARARKAGGADFKKVPAWEGMLSALSGKQPIMVHANEVRQIKTAVAWAKRRKLKIVLAASRDAWQVADLLAKEKVPVIFDNVFTLPQRDTDPHDIHFRAAGILHKAGVKIAHSEPMGSWGASRVRNIVYAAGKSMAYGLPRETALRSLTLHPAQMLGVADRLGSLTPKKEATFIAVNGDIFDIRANVKHMWIAGKKIRLQSRHTRLYEKYKNRPKPIK